jgi:hypothetical protein
MDQKEKMIKIELLLFCPGIQCNTMKKVQTCCWKLNGDFKKIFKLSTEIKRLKIDFFPPIIKQMSINHLTTSSEFRSALGNSSKLKVIDFFASKFYFF